MNEEPLNKKFIKELLALLKVPNEDIEKSYMTGRKIKLSEESNRYDISYFPTLPIKTSTNVIRLTGYDVVIPEENFKASNCYSNEIGNCGFTTKNYVSIDPNIHKEITAGTLKKFIFIGSEYSSVSDFDDMTLEYLLRIITIPLDEIITKNNPEFLIRQYEIQNELGNNQNYYYPADLLKKYKPERIELNTNRSNNKREYSVVYATKNNIGITLFIERLNIEGTKTRLRITGGPMP